jgi:uncharacterized protein (TIGR03790 family)
MRGIFLSIAGLLLLTAGVSAGNDLSRPVVIVCNADEPESRPLAEYYAERRAIPTNHICVLRIRPAETITRKEFNDQIRQPLRQFLSALNTPISYIALIYGVPLRIQRDPTLIEHTAVTNAPPELLRNEAAVDSELTLVRKDGVPVTGPVGNPLYDQAAGRVAVPLLVGRLDGPSPAAVRGMIDDALTAERRGLQGRAYFDARGFREGAFAEGDNWIRAAWEMFQRAGFECELDEQPGVFAQDYPMTDVAVYAGWYAHNATGVFTRPGFKFNPGAVACHIHSYSAESLRTSVAGWVGPFVAKGAAATTGNVYEPYLPLTPHLDKFFSRLLDGATFLEAGYSSLPVLSWQTTFVGDPLYRPFALALEDQIARMQADKDPAIVWAYLRKINRLAAREQWTEAVSLCRARAKEFSSPVLYEKLGDLLTARQEQKAAVEAYREAMSGQEDGYRYLRVGRKLGDALMTVKRPKEALAVYEGLAAAFAREKVVVELWKKCRDVAAAAGDDRKRFEYDVKVQEAGGRR